MKKATKLEVLRGELLRRLDSAARLYQGARRDLLKAQAASGYAYSAGFDRGFALARDLELGARVQELADALEVAVPVWWLDGTLRIQGCSTMAQDARCDHWEWTERRRKEAVAARLGLLVLPPEDFVGRYAERALGLQEVRA